MKKQNNVDIVKMDVPLFIRMLEFAKEDAKTDMDLHVATENVINLCKNDKSLTMANYDTIVNLKKKVETKEQMDASCSGSVEGPVSMPVVRRKIKEDLEIDEVTDSSSSGAFDVPFGGGTKGRKNPLKIDGPNSIDARRKTMKKKKTPMLGGPGAKFVRVKEKCKKFPYCNEGPGAIEFVSESMDVISEAILETSIKYGISVEDVKKLVFKEIKDIFIK